jgi:hypothetical protein
MFCRCDESAENGAGGRIFFSRTFGMPLYGQHEMIGRGAFERFDDAVGGAASDDAQAFADAFGGLMVGGVDGEN